MNDGTTIPIITGFAVLGLTALGVALISEKGRLFQATSS